MRPRRVLHSPTAEPEPFDPAAFPGLEERRRADGGAASERWRELIAANRTVIADGAMGTMLFANGLMFGDPPEVWNLSKPDVIRRIHRGYLDAGSQILMTNTFGGNRMRLSLHGLQDRVAELNQTAAILLRSEVDAAGGDALVAGDIGPSGAILAPTGTLDYDEAVDIFAEQAAALVAGGVDLIWIETMSDLTEIKAAIEGVRRVSPGIALITTMTFDTRGHTMMGVSPEQAVASLTAWGADAVGGNCGNGPDELITVIERMRAADPDVILVAKSNAGMPELVDMRAVYRADPETMADGRAGDARGGCVDHRRLLRQHARASRPRSRRRRRLTARARSVDEDAVGGEGELHEPVRRRHRDRQAAKRIRTEAAGLARHPRGVERRATGDQRIDVLAEATRADPAAGVERLGPEDRDAVPGDEQVDVVAGRQRGPRDEQPEGDPRRVLRAGRDVDEQPGHGGHLLGRPRAPARPVSGYDTPAMTDTARASPRPTAPTPAASCGSTTPARPRGWPAGSTAGATTAS